jgi:hypothetical protein
MMPPVYIPGLTKSDAEDRAQLFKDTGWTTEVVRESDGTYTLKATPPDGTPLPDDRSGDGSPPASAGGGGQSGRVTQPPVGSVAAQSLSDRVPIPPPGKMNTGLSACRVQTMLDKFGKPGGLTQQCSAVTGSFKDRIRRDFNVGPFQVTGLDYAAESLLQIFNEVRVDNQSLYDQVKNDGMLCVRARRHSSTTYSNHSWGTAIDINFGAKVVD